MRVGRERSSRRLSLLAARRPFEGWRGGARRFFVLAIFLVQFFVPLAHGHWQHPQVAAASAAEADAAAPNSGADQAALPCPHHRAAASQPAEHPDQSPCPCQQDDCCCPCCSLGDAFPALLPPEIAQQAHPAGLSETIAPPEAARFVASPSTFEGRPRAPPFLI